MRAASRSASVELKSGFAAETLWDNGAGPAPRYLPRFVPTSPDGEVKGGGNSQAATIRASMRYVTMGCSPGRRRGQGFAGFPPPARDCQTRVPVAILALRLPTEVEEAA